MAIPLERLTGRYWSISIRSAHARTLPLPRTHRLRPESGFLEGAPTVRTQLLRMGPDVGQNVMALLRPSRHAGGLVVRSEKQVGVDIRDLLEQRLPALLDRRRRKVHSLRKFAVGPPRQRLHQQMLLAIPQA